MNFLLLAVEHNTPMNYLPIALQLVIAIGFIIVMMVGTHMLGPKRRTHDKLVNFESGIPSVGNARQPMGIKYFLWKLFSSILMPSISVSSVRMVL
jgi:NADH-quinone oxidoreductase subunit A